MTAGPTSGDGTNEVAQRAFGRSLDDFRIARFILSDSRTPPQLAMPRLRAAAPAPVHRRGAGAVTCEGDSVSNSHDCESVSGSRLE